MGDGEVVRRDVGEAPMHFAGQASSVQVRPVLGAPGCVGSAGGMGRLSTPIMALRKYALRAYALRVYAYSRSRLMIKSQSDTRR